MGGMLGYAIGALFWNTAGLWLIGVLHIPLSEVEALRQRYTEHAYLIVVQGLTPIPYKLVTIASGLAGVPFSAVHALFGGHAHPCASSCWKACWSISSAHRPRSCSRNISKLALIVFLVLVVLGFVALRYL